MTQEEFDKRVAAHEADQELQTAVREALENAEDNGYDMLAMSDSDIADDIAEFCAPVEGLPRETLIPLIQAWRADKVAE